VKRAGPGPAIVGDGTGGGEEGVVGEEGVFGEVTEICWEAVEDDTWVSGVSMVLDIETAADDAEDAVEEAKPPERTCVCLWSAM
jgi:hypothetical protein